MINTFEKSAGIETEPQAAAQPEHTWHWCAACKLASAKQGTCPGCGTPYAVAPAVGVPGAPYMPKMRPDRSRRSMLASVAGIAALFLGCAFGIFMLASHGATTIDSSDASATGSTVDGQSSFGIASLHGSLRLNGGWSAANLQPLQVPAAATGGAAIKTELSVSRAGETILIGSFTSGDPSSVLNQFVMTKPQTDTDSAGNKITTEASRDVSIAGYTAVAQDVEMRNPKGGLVSRGTFYAVSAGDRVVVIRTSVPAAQAANLTALEQALVNIG